LGLYGIDFGYVLNRIFGISTVDSYLCTCDAENPTIHIGKKMTSEELLKKAENDFTRFLELHRLRKTPERFAILRKAFSYQGHFTAEGLHADLEASTYHVSLATIYNTIRLLSECEIIRSHQFGDGQTQYEISIGNHLHLICTQCGRIREVEDKRLLAPLVDKRYRLFKATYISAYVYGICANCARQNKKENKIHLLNNE